MICERCQAPGYQVRLFNLYTTALCQPCMYYMQRELDGLPAVDAYAQADAMLRYWLAAATRQDVLPEYRAALTTRDQCGTALKQVIWGWLRTPPNPREDT